TARRHQRQPQRRADGGDVRGAHGCVRRSGGRLPLRLRPPPRPPVHGRRPRERNVEGAPRRGGTRRRTRRRPPRRGLTFGRPNRMARPYGQDRMGRLTPPMTSILVVCTGNVCRSPIAEGFLRAAFEARIGSDAPEGASGGAVGGAGLGGAPGHTRAFDRRARSRTFTLKELVRLLEALPERDDASGQVLPERIAAADELRRHGFEGDPWNEGIVDPLGMPLDGFRAVAAELDEWCSRLADGLVGRAHLRSATGSTGSRGGGLS